MLNVGSAVAAFPVWAHRLTTFLTVEAGKRLPRGLSALPTTQGLVHVNAFPAGKTGSGSWHDDPPSTNERQQRMSHDLRPSSSSRCLAKCASAAGLHPPSTQHLHHRNCTHQPVPAEDARRCRRGLGGADA